MTSASPDPAPENTSDIASELRELGKTLADVLRNAWQSDERKRVQAEIEAGLVDARDSLKQAAEDFSQSETGQTLKNDLQEFQQRLQSGEVETKLRGEILTALRTANAELKKAASRETPPPPPETPPQA